MTLFGLSPRLAAKQQGKKLSRRRKTLLSVTELVASVQTNAQADVIYLDPVDYAREVLHVTLTEQQANIARSLRLKPWRVAVDSANNQGKTFLAAVLVNWWFDTFRESSAVITTAPSSEHVTSVLWGEVRTLRQNAGLPGFETRAMAPLLYDNPSHYAKGLATDRGERLKGRHFRHMLFIVDEAVGVETWVFDAIRTMFQEDGNHSWLLIGNPTDPTSQMWLEEQLVDLNDEPVWTHISLSAIEHPNVTADLHTRGREKLGLPAEPTARIPGAVTLTQLEAWLASGAEPILAENATATDLQWPPEWWRLQYTPLAEPRWFRPGAEFEVVGLGRWPSQATGAVWSDAAWQTALIRQEIEGELSGYLGELPVIGCDPARKGRNYSAIMVRCGNSAVHFEQHNGWESPQLVGRLKELTRVWAEWSTRRRPTTAAPVPPKAIKVLVDSDGLGSGAVIDWFNPGWKEDFTVCGVSAAARPTNTDRYVNRRSELWFHAADLARMGQMDLSRLNKRDLQILRQQAMAPQWKFDGHGHRVVEDKQHMEDRGVQSPDAMDALNLCYWEAIAQQITVFKTPRPEMTPEMQSETWLQHDRREDRRETGEKRAPRMFQRSK